jgi:tetraacyldisaccharide 4'-kinase
MLPAGPLREPRSRLGEVDALVRLAVGEPPAPTRDSAGRDTAMTHEPLAWRNVARPNALAEPSAWRSGIVHAVAGIGNPGRFFDLLRRLGLEPVCHAFPDHHRYVRADLEFPDATAILMTEKDAVKCAAFADGRCWYLPIRARIEPALIARLERTLRGRQAA